MLNAPTSSSLYAGIRFGSDPSVPYRAIRYDPRGDGSGDRLEKSRRFIFSHCQGRGVLLFVGPVYCNGKARGFS
jgi:hypothetical protein